LPQRLNRLRKRADFGFSAKRNFAGAKQAAETGLDLKEGPEKHTSGAKALIDLIGFMPGINPRHTTGF
jgi:hypothetical protein